MDDAVRPSQVVCDNILNKYGLAVQNQPGDK